MNQTGFSKILTLLFVVLAIVGYFYYQKNNQMNITSQNPSNTSSPAPLTTPTKEQWKNYESGQVLDGISINYPNGWVVKYRKEYNLSSDYNAKYRITFDFAPLNWESSSSIDWMGWGSMSFDVYDPQKDINQWIDKYLPEYKNNLVVKGDTKIGSKPTFLINADGKADWSVGWIPRDVILGSEYYYQVSFSQNGDGDFVKRLKEEIFPYIHIN